jgi:tetratricopeptide (TPR) repeat protein
LRGSANLRYTGGVMSDKSGNRVSRVGASSLHSSVAAGPSPRRRLLGWAAVGVVFLLATFASDCWISYVHERDFKARDPAGWAAANHQKARELSEQEKYRQAAKLLRAVIETRTRVLGPEHRDTLKSRNNLANALDDMGEHVEAVKGHRAVLAIRARVFGPDDPDTLASRNNLANALDDSGEHAEAEKEQRAVLAIRARVFGPEHAKTLDSRMNLGAVLCSQKQYAKSEVEYRTALAVLERLRKAEDTDIALCCYGLGYCLNELERKPEALVFARRSLEGRRKSLGAWHRDTMDSAMMVEGIENNRSTKPKWLEDIIHLIEQIQL